MKIVYHTDPMCSWCYGFAPVVEKIIEDYPEITLEILTGGYSPNNKEIFSEEYKQMLHRVWASINLVSGQPFNFSFRFATDNFCYDTEPSSRALVVVQELKPELDFEFLKLMQKSFYAEGKDITNEKILKGLAEEIGVDPPAFESKFHSEKIIIKTHQGFMHSRQLGVQGFPTLLGEKDGELAVLTNGFRPYKDLKPIIDSWIRNNKQGPKITQNQNCESNKCKY